MVYWGYVPIPILLNRGSRIHDHVGTKNSYKNIHLGVHCFRRRRDADGFNDLAYEQWSECYFVKTSVHDCYRYFDLIRLEYRQQIPKR